jgi:hypothetical protein
MKILQRFLMGLGTVLLFALSLQLIAPRAVHAVVSTLVTVANTAANPVITQAADNPARTAVALQCLAIGTTGNEQTGCALTTGQTSTPFEIPAGQRLVIEYINGTLSIPVGSTPSSVEVAGIYQGSGSGYFPARETVMVPSQVGYDPQGTIAYAFSSPVTVYIDPYYSLQGLCALSATPGQGQVSCSFSLYGHLENIN